MFLLREIGHFQAPITQDLLLFGQKNLDAAIDTCRKINVQKMKFSITDIFSKCDQIRGFLRIWSHLLKKPVMENFIFCAVLRTFKVSLPRSQKFINIRPSKRWTPPISG